jgi:uncharacterized protein YoaH (UPF0181 family)
MSWPLASKKAAVRRIHELQEQGKSGREALRIVSSEMQIPRPSMKRWLWHAEHKTPKALIEPEPQLIPVAELGTAKEFNFANPDPSQVETPEEFDIWRKDKSFLGILDIHLNGETGPVKFREMLSGYMEICPEPDNWYPDNEEHFHFWRQKRSLVDMGDILNSIRSGHLEVSKEFRRMLSSLYHRVTEFRQYRRPSAYDWML